MNVRVENLFNTSKMSSSSFLCVLRYEIDFIHNMIFPHLFMVDVILFYIFITLINF